MPASSSPLSGLRVVDLSRVLAGPYAAQILGDLGADVIKIEHPRGDDTRRWGPPEHDGAAAYYLSANRNKRSRVVDFTDPPQLAGLLELIAGADVLIENYKVGDLARHGLDHHTLLARSPRLVYCSVTGFGQTGPLAPRAGYDALIQAMGGLMSVTGPDPAHPTKVGVAVADLGTGLYAVIAILAALRERDRSGLGQHCDLALLDVQVAGLANLGMNYLCTGVVPRPLGDAHASIVPYQSFAAADRPLMLAVGNDVQFAALARVLGEPGWSADPRYATNPARVAHRDRLVAAIAEKFATRPRAHWLAALAEAGVPHGPIQDLGELADDPQVRARDLLTAMDDGRTPCLRSPINLSRTPIEHYRRPPRLGEHPDADWLEPR
jgi:crotonobetainyl-CoA:carnitine CoA-transferase CaiB-like acyl-CoA transferase